MKSINREQQKLRKSVELLGSLLMLSESRVPGLLRRHALFRRMQICFLALYDYYEEISPLPTQTVTPLAQWVSILVEQNVVSADETKALLMLGEVIATLDWRELAKQPDESLIMNEVPMIYAYLKRVVNSFGSPSTTKEVYT